MATATDVIWIVGFVGSPNLRVNPPIPATKIADATKMFLAFPKSTFSAISILTPELAINPYKTKETPPVTHPGIVDNNAVKGVTKPTAIDNIAANKTTLTEAIPVVPITATF